MQGKSYTDEEKRAALETVNACGGNVAQAARLISVPERSLREWANGKCVSDEVFADFAAKKAGRVAAKIDALLDRLADSLADEDCIAAAPLQARATTFGILFDKRRLGRAEPTLITAHRDEAALAKMRAEAEEALQDALLATGGDRVAALAMLRECAPTLSEYVN